MADLTFADLRSFDPVDGPAEHDPVEAARSALIDALGHPAGPLIDAAIALAVTGHAGQWRASGEPYVIHPLHVGALLAAAGWDETTVAAGVCHDLLEDTAVGADAVGAAIGTDGVAIVEGVTRIDRLRTGPDAEADEVRKLLGAVAGDVRVLAVKLADRLHNMRTLQHLPEAKQQRVARQTLELLAPLAHRIGAIAWAGELEDRAFLTLDPERSAWLDAQLGASADARAELERDAAATFAAALAHAGIDAEISSRTKGRYSLWRKLQRVGDLESVWDLVGLRVVVADPAACYAALGVAHQCFTPVPGRFKDYIALPKPNGYRSLHTTVLDDQARHFELQLRDTEMHRDATYGTAAHHLYKHGRADLVATDATGLGPEQFLAELADELASVDHVLVLTPRGRVVTLPAGACAIDFAYAVHSEIGHRCVGARVNGKLVPIRDPLATGDVVEILTRANAAPSRDWIEAVASAAARAKIRRFFAQADRGEHERAGKAVLDRLLRELDEADDVLMRRAMQRAGVDTEAELYRRIGAGKVDAKALLAPPVAQTRRREVRPAAVSVEGLNGMRSQTARCCDPAPGDELVGYVSVGRGVILHRRDCANVTAMQRAAKPEDLGRFLELLSERSRSTVTVTGADREGLLADVSAAFTKLGVNIVGSRTRVHSRGVEQQFDIAGLDPELEDELLRRLQRIPSVMFARMA